MATARTDPMPDQAADGEITAYTFKVRKISIADVLSALREGAEDFRAMPEHLLFLAILYPVICLLAVGFAFNYNLLMLVFPLAAGFALLGPFAAIGLYELSRRRELNLDTRWWHMFDVARFASAGSILALGVLLMAVFVLWLLVAMGIYMATFGDLPIELREFRDQLLTTGRGWALILIGNGVGAAFALSVFAATVVSFPMMVDRKVPMLSAIGTSMRAVAINIVPMAAWGLIVIGLLLLGCLPLFVGLAVVLPILGHATWHLYTRVVER